MVISTVLFGFVLGIAWFVLRDINLTLQAPYLGPEHATPINAPLVSVIIPARNEALRITACLEGLARQSYRHFEVIVIDDHSTDGTAMVVQRYMQRIPGLRVISSATLPHGWSGKSWACWQGSQLVNGDWLLFLDADVTPGPALIGALIERAEAGVGDLITLMPLLHLGSLAERLLLPAFFSLLYALYPPALVSDPRHGLAFANGPCIFVSRRAYQQSGGHRVVRASILDDVDLARAVHQAGFQLYAADAPDLISVRMYTGWHSAAEGLSKNAVAGYHSGGRRSAWLGLRQGVIAFAPVNLLLIGALLHSLAPGLADLLLLFGTLLVLLTSGWAAWLMHVRHRLSPAWGLLYPLGLLLYYLLAFSAWLRLRRGSGVTWKGRRLA